MSTSSCQYCGTTPSTERARYCRRCGKALLVSGHSISRSGKENLTRSYESADRHADCAPAKSWQVDALADHLTGPFIDPAMKARALYRWITRNIAYDVEMYFHGKSRDQSAQAVLDRQPRNAVCAGYAYLFDAMAKRAGLRVEIVRGFARGAVYDSDRQTGEENHAWNAVYLDGKSDEKKWDGKWEIVECTWGAGHLDGSRFVPRFSNFYFFPPPEALLYSHYPTEAKWQLVSSPISRAEQERLPQLTPDFFDFALELDSHRENPIRTSSELNFTLRGREEISVLFTVCHQEISFPTEAATWRGGRFFIASRLPVSGRYVLNIYAARKPFENGALHPQVASFKIECRTS